MRVLAAGSTLVIETLFLTVGVVLTALAFAFALPWLLRRVNAALTSRAKNR